MEFPYPEFEPLWSRLRGRGYLWHITTLNAFANILKEGQITHNAGQFSDSYPQSKNSYGRHLKAVSLCDYDTESEQDVLVHVMDFPPIGVMIRIRRDVLKKSMLRSPKELQSMVPPVNLLPEKVLKRRGFVPYIETLYLEPVPAASIDGCILSVGSGEFYETDLTADIVERLSAVRAGWDAESSAAQEATT